jgi:hypothetical protein
MMAILGLDCGLCGIGSLALFIIVEYNPRQAWSTTLLRHV